jgi:hypothetical protein
MIPNPTKPKESAMQETSSLRPEDIEVQTFAPLTPGFHIVDEDPVDPASGRDLELLTQAGGIGHV